MIYLSAGANEAFDALDALDALELRDSTEA
jgi:hypothetical protein